MTIRSSLPVLMALAGWMAYGGAAAAQINSPLNPGSASEVGGVTGQVMSRLYQNSVGSGYSVSSLNTQTLRQSQAQIPFVGQTTTRSGPVNFGLPAGSSVVGKPFDSYSAPPTTSPYLNLFREDFDGNSDVNYQTLVRPQLQQEQFNDRARRQSVDLSRRIQAVAAQGAFRPQGAEDQYPTGHKTVFGYHSHFYPPIGRRAR